MEKITNTAAHIKASRKLALEKVIGFLSAENIDGQFDPRDTNFWGKEKFIVTWSGNYKGMLSELQFSKCDPMYFSLSGYKCTYSTVGLFHQHQYKGYPTIHRGLLEIGLKLCANRKEQREFYTKYVIPYNEKLKKQRDGND